MRLRRAVLLVAAVGLVVALGPPAWSQEIPRATCLDCHEGEGMEYAVIRSTPFVEVPTGETQTLEVTVANPWLHEITGALVTVDLNDAPGLSFQTPDPIHREETTTVDVDETVNFTFPVQRGATGVVASMQQPPDESEQGLNDVDSAIVLPDGSTITGPADGVQTEGLESGNPEQPRPAREVERIVIDDTERLTSTGDWDFSLERQTGPPDDEIAVTIDVYYNASRLLSQQMPETVAGGGSATVGFPIQAKEQGEVTVRYNVTLTAYYDHPDGISSQDEGNYTLGGERSFSVGESLEMGDAGPAVPAQPPVNWELNSRAWGEATGFIGLFIVPLSLVLGGAFGRRNVLWVNEMVGSARLRVLWHNALSFSLLGLTLLHLVLFLYESAFSWSVGMVWGGASTLSLIGLAITGGFQQRFARSLGYAKWRLLHIAMAVAFVATLLVHVLVDGVHFDGFRAALGLT